MWFHLLVILICILVFERASNYLIDGLGAVSQHFGMSEAVLGASIAAMGSSAPEFGSSAFSVIQGETTIGLGTIVGSAIFNVTVIIGGAALFGKCAIEKRIFYRDGLFYLFTVLIAVLSISDGELARLEAIIWTALFLVYLAWLVHDAKIGKPVPKESFSHLPIRKAAVYISIGLIAIAIAARFLISSVAGIFPEAETQATFSLLIIAIGTSVPDLFVSLQAGRKGMGSMAVSNALGSNIFDILACLGIPFSFRVGGTEVEPIIGSSLIALLGTIVLALVVLRTNWSVSRKEGGLLLGAYGAYITLTLLLL